jgi:hypothetical protein
MHAMLSFFFNYGEHANEKTKTQKKIDENNHVCGLDLMGVWWLGFDGVWCGAYLVCYFV